MVFQFLDFSAKVYVWKSHIDFIMVPCGLHKPFLSFSNFCILKSDKQQKNCSKKVLLNFDHLQKFMASKPMSNGQCKYFSIWSNCENALWKSFYTLNFLIIIYNSNQMKQQSKHSKHNIMYVLTSALTYYIQYCK